jgi:rhodanese-related sulfurtransferase
MNLRRVLKEAVYVGVGAVILFSLQRYGNTLIHPTPLRLKIGSQVSFLKLPLSNAERTYVLFVSPSATYSQQNLSFHQQLAAMCARKRIPLWVVVPDANAADWYAQQLGVPLSFVVVRNLTKVGIVGTPTLMTVGRTGAIDGLWEGYMRSAYQDALLTYAGTHNHIISSPSLDNVIAIPAEGVKQLHIQFGAGAVTLPRPSPSQEAQYATQGHGQNSSAIAAAQRIVSELQLEEEIRSAQFIDVRDSVDFDLGSRQAATNIPLSRLQSRAAVELDKSKLVLIDCSRTETAACDLAGYVLAAQGFISVGLVDRGARELSCKVSDVM